MRLGLDYDKYVQYENHRDQDLSARSVFEGDLDCTIDDVPVDGDTERKPHKAKAEFALDFQALYASQEPPAN